MLSSANNRCYPWCMNTHPNPSIDICSPVIVEKGSKALCTHKKEVWRHRAALPETPRWVKKGQELTIYLDCKPNRSDTFHNEAHHCFEIVPLHSIICFKHVQFHRTTCILSSPPSADGMNTFISNQNIIRDQTTWYECALLFSDDLIEYELNPVGQYLYCYFI